MFFALLADEWEKPAGSGRRALREASTRETSTTGKPVRTIATAATAETQNATGEAPPESKGRERRRYPRFSCEGRAEVSLPHGGLLVRGRILDVSIAGCFIETSAINLERGTHVEVFFESRQLRFRVAGNIAVLHPPTGVGISFLHPSIRVAQQIGQLVKELAEIA
jgi:hypothetical protein